MKYIVLILISFLFSFSLIAQTSESGYSIEGDKDRKFNLDADWMDKIVLGGNVGLSFENNFLYLNLSPNLGYQITEKLTLGTGVSYIYSSFNGVSFHNYGANFFSRYKIFDQIFAMAQYELLNYDSGLESGRENYSTLLLGGGLAQPIGGNAYLVVSALYNVLYDTNSLNNGPYNSPLIVSGGISLGF